MTLGEVERGLVCNEIPGSVELLQREGMSALVNAHVGKV